MKNARKPEARSANDDRNFVVDYPYVREQAREAFTLFITPITGIIGAATGIRNPGKPKR